jgi:hypothetical protein
MSIEWGDKNYYDIPHIEYLLRRYHDGRYKYEGWHGKNTNRYGDIYALNRYDNELNTDKFQSMKL